MEEEGNRAATQERENVYVCVFGWSLLLRRRKTTAVGGKRNKKRERGKIEESERGGNKRKKMRGKLRENEIKYFPLKFILS